MENNRYLALIGGILLSLALSGATAYVAGYFIYVFMNC